ncbi:hypothetical protein K466DRAFT_569924 [Polyporus arcularius HHB13444]|uniref:Uncharacterized protein n=1 Tax=Polyporus arcularius HHB13444 TaxID=1314778 RepID=A0A5C3NRF1_9APHY|nr:hypothetical protein K466DRAFT_569924 [Polyporus arcularius HHB13444]
MLSIVVNQRIWPRYLVLLADDAAAAKDRWGSANLDIRGADAYIWESMTEGCEMVTYHASSKVREYGESVGNKRVELRISQGGDRQGGRVGRVCAAMPADVHDGRNIQEGDQQWQVLSSQEHDRGMLGTGREGASEGSTDWWQAASRSQTMRATLVWRIMATYQLGGRTEGKDFRAHSTKASSIAYLSAKSGSNSID